MKKNEKSKKDRPNILFIMVDQMHYPRYTSGGFNQDISDILGFKPMEQSSNDFSNHYPGFMALRKNAVVLNNHRIATSACVPSRTALFTGQYGTKTGVTKTDGVFKSGTDKNFPWLNPKDMPTIGSYMREAGYRSYYVGKWHMSGEDTSSLEDYGFSDWEMSYPDPHGYLPNNLGHYRDYQFRDAATSLLRREGLAVPYDVAHAQQNAGIENAEEPKIDPDPWFAVCSFTNPHDIATYPFLPNQVCDQRVQGQPYTLAVPTQNTKSNPAEAGSMQLILNKTGLPQDNSEISPTWEEDIKNNNKPDCQLDYSYKVGLALTAAGGLMAANENALQENHVSTRDQILQKAINYTLDAETNGVPLTMTPKKRLASTAFMQYYAYLFSEVDQHIKSVLDTLEETGQADNTIVVFCPDHGEYAGAHHMLIEKWHSAYEEALHVPMVVRFPEGYEVDSDLNGLNIRQEDKTTSHIDILPTILGLAGIDMDDAFKNMQKKEAYSNLQSPVGIDLSKLIKDKDHHKTIKKINDREGVLFITYDTITEPLNLEESMNTIGYGPISSFEVYAGAVEKLIENGNPNAPDNETSELSAGPVVRPGYVHCVVDNDNWKLVRYFDQNNDHINHQYELYDLNSDLTEEHNLLIYNKNHRIGDKFPVLYKPKCQTEDRNNLIREKAKSLRRLMDRLESEML